MASWKDLRITVAVSVGDSHPDSITLTLFNYQTCSYYSRRMLLCQSLLIVRELCPLIVMSEDLLIGISFLCHAVGAVLTKTDTVAKAGGGDF